MKRRLIFILSLILASCAMCVAANEYQQIDLKTAIDVAEKNNLDIKSAQMDVDIAKNEIKISNRLQNPSVVSTWNFGKAGKGNPNQIGIFQTIELFKRDARKKLAKANYKLTAENFEYQKFDLKMDVAEAYVKLIVAKSILKKYEHQQRFLEDLLEISNRNNTEKPDLDTMEARIALNQMIAEVNNAKTDAKTARIEFNKIINSPDSKYDAPDMDLSKNSIPELRIPQTSAELPPFKSIEDSVTKNRYDVKIAQNEIKTAQRKMLVVGRQRIPDIEISSGYGYQTVGLSDDNQHKSGAFLAANLVNIPILYNYRPEIKNAELEVEKANLNYISTVNKAKKDIEIAYEKFVTAKLNLENYNDKILKDSEDLFSMFEKKYKSESVDFATLAAVEESYQDLVVGYSDALSDYYISWINFLREINSETFDFNNQKL